MGTCIDACAHRAFVLAPVFPIFRGTCRIHNRRDPEISRCSNFEHFSTTRKNTERYRIDFPLFGPQFILARRCELGLKYVCSEVLRF